MKKIFFLLSLLTLQLSALAQVIYSTSESNKLLTSYTGGFSNDSIFVFCNTSSLSADASGGTAPYTFNWYQYQVNTHQFSTTPYATQNNSVSSTISSLASGGYKVVITDAGSNVVGCDIAWVWNINLATSAGSTINGCSPFSLSGNVNDNGTNAFKYYNPPADQLIIGPTTTITVCFNGTHTWVSDLGFYLVGPPSCGSPSIVLSPNPGSIGEGSICNSGDNFNNLCFTTSPAANIDVCVASTPLTGLYSSYGATPTSINWAPLYGCNAATGGWVVQVYDCIGGDVGILTGATITFSGAGLCGNQTITYNSGTINSAINDNACSSTTAASYTVPLAADTTAKTVTNALAYNWTSNPPITITNGNTLNPSVNPNPSVDTWFYMNVSGTYGCNKVDSVFFHYTAPNTPTITVVNPLCSNSPAVTLTVTPSGGTWNGTGVTNTVTGVFDPTVSGAGTFTVNYTGGGCTGNASTTITVDQAASLSSVSNVTLCNGQVQPAISFTANPSAGTVAWINSDPSIGLAASGTGNVPSFTATNGTQSPVTAVVTASATNNGCSAGPISFSITVNPQPIVNAGQDTGFCAGGSVVLNGSGGGTYSWLPAANLNNSTISNPTASPPSTTLYTLTVTNSLNCSSSDTVRVTVHPLPTVSGGPNKIICSGTSVQLNGTGATIYSWAPASSLNNPGISNPTAFPTVTTQYTVTGTDVFGCSKNAIVTVVVNAAPTINAGPDVAFCKGGNTTLNVTGTATSYTWSPVSGLSNPNGASTTATPAATTSYVISASSSNGCISKDTVVVTVYALPPVSAGADANYCAGGSVQLNATGANTYSWTPATGLSATNISNPVANPAITTQYIVTGTDANTCVNSDTIKVIVHALPVVDAGNTQSICPNGVAQLNASGATNYTWLPTSGLSNPNSSNPTASPFSTTIYTVIGTDINGCSGSDTVSVLVGTALAVSAGNNQSICIGATTTLNATSTATSYTWSPATGLSGPNSATTSATPTVTTTYTVTAAASSGCPGTSMVTITVNNLPTINVPSAVNICLGSSQTINASGAQTYTWTPATGLSNANVSNPVANPTVNMVYTVTGTDVNGCVNNSIVNVTVNSLPVIDTVTSAATNCGSTTGSVQVGTVSGNGPFVYSLNNGTSQSSNQFTGLGAGNYNVTVKDVNGCKASQLISVASVNNVHAAFVASPTTGSYPLNVLFTNNSTGANTYIWTYGNGSGSSFTNPSTVYGAAGSYTVALIAYNNIPSCSDTAYATILVVEPPKVAVPNIVTPNGDGVNDEFSLIGYGIASYEGTFYDRWGKVVGKVSGDGNTKWNPQDLHDGTYYYVITVKTIDGKSQEFHDYLTIIR